MNLPARVLLLLALTAAIVHGPPVQARDVLLSSRFSNAVLRYDGQTGAFIGVFATGNGLANLNGIAYGSDGHLYVVNGDVSRVLRFHGQTGAFLGEFITPATPGGLVSGRAIAFGPDGNLYICSGGTNQVLAYSGTTGEFLRVAAAGQGMSGPVGLTFGPDGTLYVGCALSNRAYAFSPSGTFLRSYTCGTPRNHVGVLIDGAGRLLVAQSVTNTVVAYDPATGTCLGTVAQGGGLATPIHMILDPDGMLLVGSFGTDQVLRFNPTNGQALGVFVAMNAGGLDGPHNFAYVPDPPTPAALRSWGSLKAIYR